MQLTTNRDLNHYIDRELLAYPVAAGMHIFKGGLVGLKTDGYARPLVGADRFVGIAYEEVNNTGGADGAVTVRVYTQGDFEMAIDGIDQASVGQPVFANSDDGESLVTKDRSYVGCCRKVLSAGKTVVRIDPLQNRVHSVMHVVEDLAVAGNIAERAVHAFAQSGWISGFSVVNQGTAPTGIDDLNPLAITFKVGAATVGHVTFNTNTAFPDVNAAYHVSMTTSVAVVQGDVLTMTIEGTGTADPGPFVVQVNYV